MTVQSRIAECRITNSSDANAYFDLTCTAALQDTLEGQSVVITSVLSSHTGTLTQPAPPTVAVLQIMYENTSTQIGANVTLSIATANYGVAQTTTIYLTSDHTVSGVPHPGTLRLKAILQSNTGLVATAYQITSDAGAYGTPADVVAAGDVAQNQNVGWIRSTTTAVTTLNESAYGYPDTITATTVLGAAPFQSQTVTVTPTGISTKTSAGSTTATFTTALGTCDNTLTGGLGAVSRTTTTTFPNSPLTGNPWTTATLTEASVTTDPRLSVTHYMQTDSTTFLTPPAGTTDTTHNVTSRLPSQEGDVTARLTNANGVGENGITVTHKTANHLNALQVGVNDTGLLTATQGGQAGWIPFSAWASQLSGGNWDDTITITAPSNATGLESGASATYMLLAKNPTLDPRMNVQHISGLGGRHFSAGMNLIPTCYMIDTSTNTRLLASAITSASLSVVRASAAANPDGSGTSWEYLGAGSVWTAWSASAPVYTWAMTPSTADTTTFERVLTTDSTWGTRDIRVNITLVYNGVNYFTNYIVINVDTKNLHDGYAPSLAWLGIPDGK